MVMTQQRVGAFPQFRRLHKSISAQRMPSPPIPPRIPMLPSLVKDPNPLAQSLMKMIILLLLASKKDHILVNPVVRY
jgi:hypothetical protein